MAQGLECPTPRAATSKVKLPEQWENAGRELGKLDGAWAGREPDGLGGRRPGIWEGQHKMDHLSLPSSLVLIQCWGRNLDIKLPPSFLHQKIKIPIRLGLKLMFTSSLMLITGKFEIQESLRLG